MIRIAFFLLILTASSKLFGQAADLDDYGKAWESLKIIEKLYAVLDGKHLFRETYPYDDAYQASYLGSGANVNKSNRYSYLWPFSGSLSAYTALLGKSNDEGVRKYIDDVVLSGLEQYHDKRAPTAYASYISTAPLSDRFYDDNIWLGIDFLDLYLYTKEKRYLEEATDLWTFVESGMDDKLGGGIYWCEQQKKSKNTCSNAPAVVYLLKLYEATDSILYLNKAKGLYEWTKNNLQDSSDRLYWDNINLAGKVDKAKYPYNTGQMVQAGALLYKLTGKQQYLEDAQQSAQAGFSYFFDASKSKENGRYPSLKRSDNWFIAVMLRGYVELYHQAQNKRYVDAFKANLAYAWENMRDKDGLFGKDWFGDEQPIGKRWILDQFAIAEMYARMAEL